VVLGLNVVRLNLERLKLTGWEWCAPRRPVGGKQPLSVEVEDCLQGREDQKIARD